MCLCASGRWCCDPPVDALALSKLPSALPARHQVAVWNSRRGDWPEATIAQFNASTGQHLVRYSERPPGAVKHEETWASLARTRFQWGAPPPPGAPPNPSYSVAPRGEDAVGWKVKVFWPAMARWYTGKVGGRLHAWAGSLGCAPKYGGCRRIPVLAAGLAHPLH